MKKIIMMTALVALASLSAVAQRPSREEMQQRRAEMVQQQAEKFAKDFALKGDEKDNFVAIYKAFQDELQALQQQERQRGGRDGERAGEGKKKDLTAEQATKQVEDYFARQEQQIARQLQRLAIEKDYYAKFKETLTPQQLAKIFTQRNQRQGGGQQRGGYGPQGDGQNRGPRGGGFSGGPEGGFNDGF